MKRSRFSEEQIIAILKEQISYSINRASRPTLCGPIVHNDTILSGNVRELA